MHIDSSQGTTLTQDIGCRPWAALRGSCKRTRLLPGATTRRDPALESGGSAELCLVDGRSWCGCSLCFYVHTGSPQHTDRPKAQLGWGEGPPLPCQRWRQQCPGSQHRLQSSGRGFNTLNSTVNDTSSIERRWGSRFASAGKWLAWHAVSGGQFCPAAQAAGLQQHAHSQ